MWKIIEINGKHFYWNIFRDEVNIKHQLLAKGENLTIARTKDDSGQILHYSCILYGDKECWCCELSFERIKEILKSLNFDACTANGSFKYNDALLQEMLEHGNVVDSCLFTKNECGDILKDEKRCLHLRYHYEMVHLRMIFELQRLTSTKNHNLLLSPLITQVQLCYNEIMDLKKIIQRKDDELAQFDREGYRIRRVTLITQRFNKEKHEKQYEMNSGHNFYGLIELISKTNEQNISRVIAETETSSKLDVKQKLTKKGKNWNRYMQKETVDKLQYEQNSCSNLSVCSTLNIQALGSESEIFNFSEKLDKNMTKTKVSTIQPQFHNEQLNQKKIYQFLSNILEEKYTDQNSEDKNICGKANTEEEWYLRAMMLRSMSNEPDFDYNIYKPTQCKKVKREDISNEIEKNLLDSGRDEQSTISQTDYFLSPEEQEFLLSNDNISINRTDSTDLFKRLQSIKMQIQELKDLSKV